MPNPSCVNAVDLASAKRLLLAADTLIQAAVSAYTMANMAAYVDKQLCVCVCVCIQEPSPLQPHGHAHIIHLREQGSC